MSFTGEPDAWNAALALFVCGTAVIGCGGEPSLSSSGRGDAATTADSSLSAGECAWPVRADKQTLNIAYPDTAATYWATSYALASGETLELRGAFPAARYASFISYGPSGGALDVLTDRDIEPDQGSTNPFAGAPGGSKKYTFVISGERSDENRPNVLGARGGSAAMAVDAGARAIVDAGLSDVLGSGGADAARGTVLYRVYVPDDAGDPTGGAGLPEMTLVDRGGHRHPIPTCSSPGPSPAGIEIVDKYGPPTDTQAPAQPVFIRPASQAASLYPNPDNVYIATIVAYQPGRVVVVQGAAPKFPDPPNGRPIGSGEQVRYWSLCTNEYRKPYPVSYCVFDRNVVLDSTGKYTFVISTPDDKPANATEANGVTWLEWGSTSVNNLLLMRHMLASPDFAESAINVPPGSLAATTMGDYAPRGTYCDRSAFEQGGASACAP